MNKDLILTFKLFSFWILMLVVFVYLGGIIFGDLSSIKISGLGNWDGEHFVAIADKGYTERLQYAFFPLYPLTVNFISNILSISLLSAGLMVSLISSFGIIFFFIKILKRLGETDYIKTIIYFLIFPTSFYLIAVYSESIFLLFTLMAFYMVFEKKLLLGVVFVALASSSRVVGIATALGVITETYITNKNYNDRILSFFALSGFLIYCLYLFLTFNNPLYFLVSELNWDRVVTLPGKNIWETNLYLAYYGLDGSYYTIFLDLLFTIFGIGFGLRTIRFLRPSLYLYTILCLLIPLTTSILLSFPRFLIVVFPIFILVGRIKNKIFQTTYAVCCLTLLFIFFNLFLRNIWVS